MAVRLALALLCGVRGWKHFLISINFQQQTKKLCGGLFFVINKCTRTFNLSSRARTASKPDSGFIVDESIGQRCLEYRNTKQPKEKWTLEDQFIFLNKKKVNSSSSLHLDYCCCFYNCTADTMAPIDIEIKLKRADKIYKHGVRRNHISSHPPPSSSCP